MSQVKYEANLLITRMFDSERDAIAWVKVRTVAFTNEDQRCTGDVYAQDPDRAVINRVYDSTTE